MLKKHFGYSTFRPLQAEIIRDALAGRDVFALLPTGGGKSLCFQLPAVLQEGLTVVVSPLIALMKDQVDTLQAIGIPATFLNSSLSGAESRARQQALRRGDYRLLYVAPERLMLPGFLDALKELNVRMIAVDEAHCISEWGHDFRPEYRQLAEIRSLMPNIPIMALTATATMRVRADIINQLKLRNPTSYVASFNRPNLSYRVIIKDEPSDQVVAFVKSHARESGIVYCMARKTTERLAALLCANGVPARAYHAGLTAEERTKNQELFLRDDVRVICATIAFGMGINKPNVRYVVHYDLPKNIEGYYQETGRAGRDGLPSECVLLFSAGDMVKQLRFLDDKEDPRERAAARAQLEQMVAYADSPECRRVSLLGYFDEPFQAEDCRNCDNCVSPAESYDATISAHKLLSCVYRVREHSGCGFGLKHVLDVLTGSAGENVKKRGHDQVSTYGVGREHTVAQWRGIASQLLRRGYLRQDTDNFNVLSVTAEGMAVLKRRDPVQLLRPRSSQVIAEHHSNASCDEILLEALTALRKRLADERNVPAYVLISDVALRQMARNYPTTIAQLGKIIGFVQKKVDDFGGEFLLAIAAHLRQHERQSFKSAYPAGRPKPARAAEDTDRGPFCPADEKLFECLRELRIEMARERKVPAYVIAHDAVLREMCRRKPQNIRDLGAIPNFGHKRAAIYGQAFLQALGRNSG